MIAELAIGMGLIGAVAWASRSRSVPSAKSTQPSSNPAPVPAPPIPSSVPGDTIDSPLVADQLLAVSPALNVLPVVMQTIQLATHDPFSLDESEAIPVMAIAMRISPDRLVALIPPSEVKRLLDEVPAAESKVSDSAKLNGFYVSFPPDRIWALGGMAA